MIRRRTSSLLLQGVLQRESLRCCGVGNSGSAPLLAGTGVSEEGPRRSECSLDGAAFIRRRWASTTPATSFQPERRPEREPDHRRLLVVGSGVAGMATALVAAETHGLYVTIVCAGPRPTDCNSYWAQGGIIYRSHDVNEVELLVDDITRAGAGLCVEAAVRKVAVEGPQRVRQLLLGNSDGDNDHGDQSSLNIDDQHANKSPFATVPFDRDSTTGQLSLCLEASHSAPRILHTADHTGATLTEHLAAAALRHPRISFQPNTIVTDVIVDDATGLCCGVESLQTAATTTSSNHHKVNGSSTASSPTTTAGSVALQKVVEFASHGVVLAAGGLAGIYEHSTNPSGFNALGSSVAIASRAHVTTLDLEFVQFHPTALSWPHTAPFLLTEALRGEGAILRDANGRAFCRDYHVDAELAPRDVVARAVFDTARRHGPNGKVYLDITHRDAHWVRSRFPTITQHLKRIRSGLDLATDWLPIVPAAHYTCGGIATDLNGCTNVGGLYAAGEAARTGLHGGNRLASTSLLEGLVFGASVADFVASSVGKAQSSAIDQVIDNLQSYRTLESTSSLRPIRPKADATSVSATAQHLLGQVRRVMWDHVGVTRTESGLNHAADALMELRHEAETLFDAAATYETAAVRDATCAGHAVALAALANPHSVGAHCVVKEDATSTSATAVEVATSSARVVVEPESDDDEAEVMAMAR